jgi:hypothetical protein
MRSFGSYSGTWHKNVQASTTIEDEELDREIEHHQWSRTLQAERMQNYGIARSFSQALQMIEEGDNDY